jgi:cation diffusion facilitator family transporter
MKSQKQQAEKRTIITGLVGNILMFIVKLFGGIVGRSSVLVADAIHTVTDVVTDIAVLVGSSHWHNPPDKDHAYGHGRIETVISFGIGLVLGFTAIQLSISAITNLFRGASVQTHFWVFWIAISSIIVKEIIFFYTLRVSKITDSMALRANAWHHRTDSLSSIPVAIAIYLTSYYPALWWVDPVGVLVVVGFILGASIDISKPAFIQLVDTGADEKIIELIRETSSEILEIKDIHNIRTRYIGSSLVADFHIEVDPGLTVEEGHNLAHEVHDLLLKKINKLSDVTVHIEPSYKK